MRIVILIRFLSFIIKYCLAKTYNKKNQPIAPNVTQNKNSIYRQLLKAVKTWSRSEYDRDKPEKNKAIGEFLYSFAVAIQQLPLGSRANNIEIAIACYEAVIEVYTRENPQKWAMNQNNLGTAYSDRIRGEKAENIENAISCYNAALEVLTRDAFPQNWATIQNNLAVAYNYRIRGEKAENIENAISCYNAALEVLTPEAFPQYWATTQNNLASAYSDRIEGERGQNIEDAIACYLSALEVFTREAFPQNWGTTQNNLAGAYKKRIRGERAENLEIAIACYDKALKVRTRDAFPEDWAVTQLYLGDTLTDRFEISHQEEDIERAIALYREVLDGYQQQSIKLDRPRIFYQLGKALSKRGSYPQAIEALEECRILLEKKVDLYLLALAFFELARLYHNIHRLEKARLYYKDTLRLFRRLKDRESVADVAVALGNLELQIGRFEQAKERLEEVRNYYEAKHRQDRLEEIDRLLELLRKPSMAII